MTPPSLWLRCGARPGGLVATRRFPHFRKAGREAIDALAVVGRLFRGGEAKERTAGAIHAVVDRDDPMPVGQIFDRVVQIVDREMTPVAPGQQAALKILGVNRDKGRLAPLQEPCAGATMRRAAATGSIENTQARP